MALQGAAERLCRIVRHVSPDPACSPQQQQHLLASPTAGSAAPPELARNRNRQKAKPASQPKSPEDVVICLALRTAITTARPGAFEDTLPDELLAPLFRSTLERTGLKATDTGDVFIGNVNQPGAEMVTSRLAQFFAGLPVDVDERTSLPVRTPLSAGSRQCSSGLEALVTPASAFKVGIFDVGREGGVESMTSFELMDFNPDKVLPAALDDEPMVLVARRSEAERLRLPVLARLRSYAIVGVDPCYMGIGPALAILKALEKANRSLDEVDVFEISEAFASQFNYCVDHLKLPAEKVNPKGGAIALGHPLGCTGSRLIATLLPELKRQQKKLGVVSMCIGTGMGAAAVIESEQ